MRDYTNLDLALAVANCKNMREVFQLAKAVKYIWNQGESINLEFFQHVSCKRIKQLACNK